MKKTITCLFLDIGGVLLSNGWDRQARERAAVKFGLDLPDMEDRHHLTFATYEEGKATLDDYLERVVFSEKQSFTRDRFRRFMFAQSTPDASMIALMIRLKQCYGLKIAVVSNEGRELNAYRIDKFRLADFVDFFVSSSFVHLRKPDVDILRLALDLAQVPASQIVYIENTPLFVHIAEGLGLRSILHADYADTRRQLAALGLRDDEEGVDPDWRRSAPPSLRRRGEA